ncbi:MAG: fumarate hydratase [Clostridia bacterium]|nr:fumarate hydratase [Clostridia bacterium]
MRVVNASEITQIVSRLCVETNKRLPQDLETCISCCAEKETRPIAQGIFKNMLDNIDAAKELDIPVCQDTGMAVVFAEIGQQVFIDGNFEDAVNEGVRRGYVDGLLRLSVVGDPIERVNTNDNTPAIIYTRLVDGDKIKITVAPKGFGSENMSAIKMFTPSAKREDIVAFVVDTVKKAGANPCPPVVLGVGIGGDFEYCAYLAKKALCRAVDKENESEFYRNLEKEMLDKINELDIGCQGFGGDITALKVNIETYPTHIAGLPVAVNVGCHVTRHASAEI